MGDLEDGGGEDVAPRRCVRRLRMGVSAVYITHFVRAAILSQSSFLFLYP